MADIQIQNRWETGTDDDDTVTGRSVDDAFTPAGGDDAVDLLDGNDTINYAGSLYTKNFLTGQTTLAFKITKDDNAVVTVEDLYGDEGTDTLTNVERLWFSGDQVEVRLVTQYDERSDTRWFRDNDGNEVRYDVRMINARGSAFDDEITGEQGSDHLSGGNGNDIIRADGDALQAELRFNFQGGDVWSETLLETGAVTLHSSVSFDYDAVGHAVRVPILKTNGQVYTRDLDASDTVGSTVKMAAVDGEGTAVDLTPYDNIETSLSALWTLKSTLEANGGEIQFWVDVTVDSETGRLLIDLESPTTLYSDDEITGEGGNDFIDGGAVAWQPTGGFAWRGNEARYEGNESDYVIAQIEGASDLTTVTTLLDGSSINDFLAAAGISDTAANFAELLTVLGVKDTYVDDSVFTLVADTVTDRDGIDILKNIQQLSFSDGAWLLEARVRTKDINWGEAGKQVDGGIFGELIDLSAENGFDNIDAREGNDIIFAGAGSDWVRGGGGNDFADGGSEIDSDKDRSRDEFSVSGDSKRYIVEKATSTEAAQFLANNFEWFDASDIDTSNSDYFFVTDRSPYGGSGTDLITGFESIQFNDVGFDLAARYDFRNVGWNSTTQIYTVASLNVNGTSYSDEIVSSDLFTKFIDRIESEVAQGELSSSYDKSVWAYLGEGDDTYLGGAYGDSVNLGEGNDLYVGGNLDSSYVDNGYGSNRVQFDGKLERYELVQLDAGFVGDVNGVHVDLSNITTGSVSFNERTISYTGAYDSAIIVFDRLPSSLGGYGVDLLLGATDLTFDGVNVDLQPDLYGTYYQDWLNAYEAGINLSYFGGQFDFGQGVLGENKSGETITVHNGWINDSVSNDDIIGFKDRNGVNFAQGGNDFFNAISVNGEDGEDQWDFFDQAHFTGTADQYAVNQVYLALDAKGYAPRDSSGNIIYQTSKADGLTQAIEVSDLRPGGDKTYLVGVEELSFEGSWQRVGITYGDSANNLSLNENFAVEYGVNSREIDLGVHQLRIEGSPFSDELVGRNVPSYLIIGTKFSEVIVPVELNDLIFNSVRGDESLIIFKESHTENSTSIEVFDQVDGYEDGIVFKIWVDSDARAIAFSEKLSELDPSSADLMDFLNIYDEITGVDADGEFNYESNWSPDWGYVDSVYLVGEVSGQESLFVPLGVLDVSETEAVVFTNVDLGSDRFEGGAGDDLLIGLDGGDRFSGGLGNDILDGGEDIIDPVSPLYQAVWANGNIDRVEYSGSSDRYLINKVFVLRDSEGYILDESLIYKTGYVSAYTITDSVSDELGGSGKDYLIDIERVWFDGNAADIWLSDAANFRLADWYPNIWSQVKPDNASFLNLEIYDRAYSGSTIDINELWASAPDGFSKTYYSKTGDAFELEGFANVVSSNGHDIVFGLVDNGPGFVTRYEVGYGFEEDYLLTRETDDEGVEYVLLELKDGVDKEGVLKSAKLYDVDILTWKNSDWKDQNLDVTEKFHYGAFFGGGTHLEGSVFSDSISAEMVLSTVHAQYTNFAIVAPMSGDDETYANGAHTLYLEHQGNDFFDGGSGIDVVMLNGTTWDSLEIDYFYDSNGNKAFDEGEQISLSEFQSSLTLYEVNSDQFVNPESGDLSTLSLSEYSSSHSAQLLGQATGVDVVNNGISETGMGWAKFADGYYVSINDLNGNLGVGSNVYKNIEAVGMGKSVIDVVTGKAYVNVGTLTPWDSNAFTTGPILNDYHQLLTPTNTNFPTVSGSWEPLADYADSRLKIDIFNRVDSYGDGEFALSVIVQDQGGDSIYTGTSGVVTVVNGSEFEQDLRAKIYDSDSSSALLNKFNGSDFELNYRDRFVDGAGDDIYLGNGIFDLMPVENEWNYSDQLIVNGSINRYEIVAGTLDSNGKVSTKDTDNETLLAFTGVAGENYLIVRDTLSNTEGGDGENLAVGISMIGSVADYNSYWFGNKTNLQSSSDTVSVLRIEQRSALWDINVQTNEFIKSSYDSKSIQSVDIRAKSGSSVFVALDNPTYQDDWDLKDKVRFETNLMSDFEIGSVWVLQAEDGSIVKDVNGEVIDYLYLNAAKLASANNSIVKRAVKLDGADTESGLKYVIDAEIIKFADDTELQGNNQFSIKSYGWEEYRINDNESQGYVWDDFSVLDIRLSDANAFHNLTADKLLKIQNDSKQLFSGQELGVIEIFDGQGDDVIFVNTINFGANVKLTSGRDFVYFTESLDTADYVVQFDNQVRFNESSDRFDIHIVYIKLTDQNTPLMRSNGKAYFFDSTEDGVTKAVFVKDKLPSSSNAYLGEKLLVGVEQIRFDGDDVRIRVEPDSWTEDWDGDGLIDMYTQRGSGISDILSFDPAKDDVRDRLEGEAGDDILIGGGGGDELRGGAGDDILIGGANGNTGNSWDDEDKAQYWPVAKEDLEVESITIGFNADTNEVLRNPFGDVIIGAEAADLLPGFELTDATQVTDLTGTYGADILIGVERIQTQTGDISANVRFDYNDWDNDGVINQVYIQGTDFSDTIGDIINSNVGLAYENGIDAGRGDDDIYAGVGGDWIRPGAGVDFVDAGANGQLNEWGWVPTDSVQFEGNFDRYIINNITFIGTALDISDAAGTRLFSIDSNGFVVRSSNESEVIFTVKNGQTLTTVEDLLPNLDFLDGDGFNLIVNAENLGFQDRWLGISVERNIQYDDNGNPMWGWMRGTLAADTILGSAAGDNIQGAEGDDTLIGLGGDDHFEGGAGDDLIYGDKVSQILGGNDHVRFSGNADQFIVTKKVGVIDDTNISRSYFEVVDLLPADIGGSGTDILVGIESISFDDKWVRIGINRWDHTDSEGVIIGSNFEGSDYGDVINGTALGDHIRDRDGNDTLYGNDGADYFEVGFGDDTIYGGAEGTTPWGSEGVDVARFSGNFTDFTVTYFDADGADTNGAYDADGYIEVKDSTDGGYGTNRLYGIERLEFDNKWINLEGYANGTYLVGSDDNDELNLNKNWGDSVDYRLEGGEGNDVLHGWSGNDLLTGDAGSDTLYGRDGSDVAIYTTNRSETTDIVKIEGSENDPEHYEVTTGSDVDKLYDIERIKFADTSLSLVEVVQIRDLDKNGDFETAIFTGKYSGTTAADFDVYFSLAAETVNGGPIAGLADTLNYIVSLGEDDDSIVLSGGNDQIYWSAGDDTIDGGDGTDEIIVNGEYGSASAWVFEDLAPGDDLINNFELRHYDAQANLHTVDLHNIERVIFSDRVVSLIDIENTIDLDGNGTPDQGTFEAKLTSTTFDASGVNANISWTVAGSDGDDALTGGDEDDILSGGLGTNTLDGGEGYDIAIYDYARADFTVNDPTITESGLWEVSSKLSGLSIVDTLVDIEALRFTDGLFALEQTSELIEEFVFGQGRVQTQVMRGTTFGEELIATATNGSKLVNVSVSGGIESETASVFDQFIVDVTELKSTRILDFEVADSGGNRDLLRLLNTDFTTVSQARDAFSVNENGDLVLISNGGELILEGLTSVDQSELNISLDIV